MMQENMMASGRSKVCCNSKINWLPRLPPELVQIYSDKPATSLKLNALRTYSARGVKLNFTERGKWRLAVNGYTLLGFLPVATAELRVEEREFEIDGSKYFYGSTPSDVVLLEKFIWRTL